MEDKDIERMDLDEKVQDFYKYFNNKKEYNLPLERTYMMKFFEDRIYKKLTASEIEKMEYIYNVLRYYNHVATRCEENCTVMKAYLYSNEHLDKLFDNPNIDVRGKNVALVGTGACQMYNALLKGAKEVTICDANMYLRPFVELKTALISTLDYKTFFNYYDYNFPENFFEQHKVYANASHYLSDESKVFWDTMMLDGDKKLLANVCHRDCCRLGSKFYRDKNEYDKLQKVLREGDFKINYIVGNYSDFPKLLNGKFSFMSFSNISDYYEKEGDFINPLISMYNNNLEEGGVIQASSRVFEKAEKAKKKNLKTNLPNSKVFIIKNSGLIYEIEGDNIPVAHSSIFVKKSEQNNSKKSNVEELTK